MYMVFFLVRFFWYHVLHGLSTQTHLESLVYVAHPIQYFQELFHTVNPDVFLDNHVSNGADYQYTFTCIATQHERLGEKLGNFFKNEMYPEMVNDMRNKKIDVIPYVNIHGAKPDLGYEQFTDTPRYATGYTTLFNTLGFVPETHMLKPYKDRVKTTYEFMVTAIIDQAFNVGCNPESQLYDDALSFQ